MICILNVPIEIGNLANLETVLLHDWKQKPDKTPLQEKSIPSNQNIAFKQIKCSRETDSRPIQPNELKYTNKLLGTTW